MKIKINKDYFLRPLVEKDLFGNYRLWFSDQNVTKYSSNGKYFKSKNFFLDYIKKSNNEKSLVMAICHIYDGHIGNISLLNISQIDQNAELAILIGEKKHWKKSLAFKSVIEIMKHGFLKLNLNKIYCGTASTNVAMNALARKVGMILEGRRVKHLYLNGKFEDLIQYGILKNKFFKNNKI